MAKVRILDSRMVHIDRQQKCCILHDGSMLPYDYLVVATGNSRLSATPIVFYGLMFHPIGLQDDALHALKIQSMGVEHVTDGYRRVNGAMSAADPSIRDLSGLVQGGTLIKSLIWNPLSYAVAAASDRRFWRTIRAPACRVTAEFDEYQRVVGAAEAKRVPSPGTRRKRKAAVRLLMWRCFLLTLLGAGVLAAGAGLLWQEFLWHGVDRFFQVPEASMEPPTPPMDARGLPALRTLDDEEPEAAGPLEEDENELEPEQDGAERPTWADGPPWGIDFVHARVGVAQNQTGGLDEVNDSQDPQTDERPRTSSAWFLQDPMSEPPGFPAFRREVEAQQRSATQWVVFSGFNGIGNWMLGAASGLLISALLRRGYAVLGAKGASGGLCHWMRSPLCDWEAPEWVMAKVRRQLELLKEQRKRRSAKAGGTQDFLS
ncbi:unnamed protein product [Effrenium voratum]|nr:unnamed protein product [Effrenium voratum]